MDYSHNDDCSSTWKRRKRESADPNGHKGIFQLMLLPTRFQYVLGDICCCMQDTKV